MDIKKNLNDEFTEAKESFFNYVLKLFKKDSVEEIFDNHTIKDNEIDKLCDSFFTETKNNVLCENTLIDLEIFEGIGNDKDNTIFKILDKTEQRWVHIF